MKGKKDNNQLIWKDAQKWEKEWWGNCQNTFGEEVKQFLYARRMGLVQVPNSSTPYRFVLPNISVLDIGGGPTSLLLKCEGLKRAVVIEPMSLPNWVKERYEKSGIEFYKHKGEDLLKEVSKKEEDTFDEVWIYNVLQHCQNPKLVIEGAKKWGKCIRIFEWIDIKISKGHLHTLTEEKLNKWLGGEGKTEQLSGQANCYGKCYYGIFPVYEYLQQKI